MTPCARFAPMIGARPGELSEAETRALEEHLGSCHACQARLADERALSAIVSAALLGEANRRDFSTFSDEVLARIAAAQAKRERGALSHLAAWFHRHRAASIAAAVAPAAITAALVVYFGSGRPPEQHAALLEVTAEGRGAMVLETSDGPVVLLGSGDSEGT